MIVALFLGGTAFAYDRASDAYWVNPKREVQLAQWPKDKTGIPVYGDVTLNCAIDEKGFAKNCAVKSETPMGQGLGSAALKLASLYRAHDLSKPPVPLDISIEWDTPPDWLQKPVFSALLAVYPSAAHGADGGAKITCVVTTTGTLRDCIADSESPPDLGFGQATLNLQHSMWMTPALRQGRAVESLVTIPIGFKGFKSVALGKAVLIVRDVLWKQAPTRRDVTAAFSASIPKDYKQAYASIQCEIYYNEKLNNCIFLNLYPDNLGVGRAVQSLIPLFTADLDQNPGFNGAYRVNLQLQLWSPDNPAWDDQVVDRPHWKIAKPGSGNLSLVSTVEDQKPEAPSATVDCIANSAGSLSNCHVIDKNISPGVRADAEAQAAGKKISPWTDEGLPADEAHVRVPVQLNDK